MPVAVRCEASAGQWRCRSDATVLRSVSRLDGDYYALCDYHRLLPLYLLFLTYTDPVVLYREAHPRAKEA